MLTLFLNPQLQDYDSAYPQLQQDQAAGELSGGAAGFDSGAGEGEGAQYDSGEQLLLQ